MDRRDVDGRGRAEEEGCGKERMKDVDERNQIDRIRWKGMKKGVNKEYADEQEG